MASNLARTLEYMLQPFRVWTAPRLQGLGVTKSGR